MPPPLNFVAVIYPGYQLLDIAGPLDVLNLLSTIPDSGLHNLKLTLVASTLDPVPNKAIPPKSGAWTFDEQVIRSSNTSDGLQNRSFNQYLIPDETFDSYLARVASKEIPEPDVVFVPGGVGVRLQRIYPNDAPGKTVLNVADAIDFFVKVQGHIKHSVMSVCTGTFVLGSAGLLNGRRATTNVMRFDDVAGMFPDVKWQRHVRWVKSTPDEIDSSTTTTNNNNNNTNSSQINHHDGKGSSVFNGIVYTSAGVTAGIDMMLSLVAETVSLDLARRAAKALEYEWSEIGEGKVDPLYSGPGWKEHLDRANTTLGKWHTGPEIE